MTKFHSIPKPGSKFLSEIIDENLPVGNPPIKRPGDSTGDYLARILAKSENGPALRKLFRALTDEKQRGIVMEAMFESLDVVDKLAWLADNGLPIPEQPGATDGDS